MASLADPQAGVLPDGTAWARFFVTTDEIRRWNGLRMDIVGAVAANLAVQMRRRGHTPDPMYAVVEHDPLTEIVLTGTA